jgi:glyoxylase-like metal-dependent hydrolase (beta-lactamase superfamily II)
MPLHLEALTLWVAQTNCFLVAPDGPGGECVLIDAPPEPQPILQRLAELELKLVALISTHGHVDHVGGIGDVTRGVDHDVPVHIHRADEDMLRDPIGQSASLAQFLEGVDVRPPEIIEMVDDGTVIRGAGMRFESLHTPGHTPGSTCFRLDVEGAPPILFSGDQLFAGSIGRTDLPGGSYEQLMTSMVEKILPLPDDVAVLPGHGPVTSIGRERATNPFLTGVVDGGPTSGWG